MVDTKVRILQLGFQWNVVIGDRPHVLRVTGVARPLADQPAQHAAPEEVLRETPLEYARRIAQRFVGPGLRGRGQAEVSWAALVLRVSSVPDPPGERLQVGLFWRVCGDLPLGVE
jgi:hypothetical protein